MIKIKRKHQRKELDFFDVIDNNTVLGSFKINRQFFLDYKELLINGHIVLDCATIIIDADDHGKFLIDVRVSSKHVSLIRFQDHIEELTYAGKVANAIDIFLFNYNSRG